MRHDDSMAKALRYTIGSLARAAAMRVSTLRFYERKGLLSPVGRSLSNYRWYDQQSLETAEFYKNRLCQRLFAGGYCRIAGTTWSAITTVRARRSHH
jgi:hypothetical protein